jgi:hypothetical protein
VGQGKRRHGRYLLHAGIHHQTNGPAFTYGANISKQGDGPGNVWQTDGLTALKLVHKKHPKWVMADEWGFHHCLTRDSGITYGAAASVEGVGVTAETQHSSVTTQCWGANVSNGMPDVRRKDWIRHGVNTDWHYSWGRNRDFSFTGGPEPTVVYTY